MHIIHLLALIVCPPLCALANRVRGGLWGDRIPGGDVPARLIWGAACGLTAYLAGAIWWGALLCVPAGYLGATVGNFEAIAVGNPPDWRKVGLMSLHGFLMLAPIALMLGFVHADWPALLISGVLCGLCYVTAYATSGNFPALGITPAQRAPAGEYLFGWVVGLGIAVAVVTGTWWLSLI